VVAGVVALMLEANPLLGWRDVQDILVRTSVQIDFTGAFSDWVENAAGLKHSYRYGFGKVDALEAVIAAEDRPAANTNVEQVTVSKQSIEAKAIPSSDAAGVSTAITVTASSASRLAHVQHVNVYVDIAHTRRGDVAVYLTSPSGVESLLVPRTTDEGVDYDQWKFMTVRYWGEAGDQLAGAWTLKAVDEIAGDAGTLNGWRLNLFGDSAGGAKNDFTEEQCREVVVNDEEVWARTKLGAACFSEPVENSDYEFHPFVPVNWQGDEESVGRDASTFAPTFAPFEDGGGRREKAGGAGAILAALTALAALAM